MTEHLQQALAGHVPGLMDGGRRYAVLCPVVARPDGPHLLFEVRASSLRRQPGEVCFPGGGMEPGETPEDCALRETAEELAIPPSCVTVWGRTDYLVHPSGFWLQPVCGELSPAGLAVMTPSPAEVDHVFTVPLQFFRETAPVSYYYDLDPRVPDSFPYGEIGFPDGYAFRGARVETPVWHYEGHAIWGLTARTVRNLLALEGLGHFPK